MRPEIKHMAEKVLEAYGFRFTLSIDGKNHLWCSEEDDWLELGEDETLIFYRGNREMDRLSNNEFDYPPLNEENIISYLKRLGHGK